MVNIKESDYNSRQSSGLLFSG